SPRSCSTRFMRKGSAVTSRPSRRTRGSFSIAWTARRSSASKAFRRRSPSTVGTMTELNDHLKLLFSRAAQLYCRDCGAPVRRDSAQSIYGEIDARLTAGELRDSRIVVTFPVPVPHNFSETEVLGLLEKQGYTRVFARSDPKAPATPE